MSKPLQEQNWTLTSSLEERNAILDLASGLGFNTHGGHLDYGRFPQVWMPYIDTACVCINDQSSPGLRLSVPDFVAGMYALAKERKEKSAGSNSTDHKVIPELTIDLNRLEERVKKLEEASKKPIPSEPLSGVRGPGYAVDFDPKASPKDIPFSVALEYLKAGRKVKRQRWDSEAWYFIESDRLLFHGCTSPEPIMGAIVVCEEILATDWMVVPE